MDGEDSNGWAIWRNHVLAELRRISDNVETLSISESQIRIEIGKLKLAAAIWGSIAGALGALIIMLVYTQITGA